MVLPVKALLLDPLVSSGSRHVRLESNLLWWKDKETLIEILPPGRFVLSFHMGLTSYFPGAQRCVWPRARYNGPHHEELTTFGGLWGINKALIFGHSCGKRSSSFSSSAGSTRALLFHLPDPSLYWNGQMYWKCFFLRPPARTGVPESFYFHSCWKISPCLFHTNIPSFVTII